MPHNPTCTNACISQISCFLVTCIVLVLHGSIDSVGNNPHSHISAPDAHSYAHNQVLTITLSISHLACKAFSDGEKPFAGNTCSPSMQQVSLQTVLETSEQHARASTTCPDGEAESRCSRYLSSCRQRRKQGMQRIWTLRGKMVLMMEGWKQYRLMEESRGFAEPEEDLISCHVQGGGLDDTDYTSICISFR